MDIQGAGVGRRIPALQRWLGAIAALFDTDAAVLVISDGGLSRVLAGYGTAHSMISTRVNFSTLPYDAKETLLVSDASNRPDLHALLGDVALARTDFFFRTPVPFSGTSTLGILAFGQKPRPNIGERQVRLACEVAQEISREFADLIAPEKAEVRPDTLGFVYAGMVAWLEGHHRPLAALDSNLSLLVSNKLFAKLGPKLARLPSGTDFFSHVATGDCLRPMMQRAIQSGESTPEIEICIEYPPSTERRYFSVMGSPIKVVDRPEPLIIVSIIEITREVLEHSAFEERSANLVEQAHPAEATVSFLAETLVQRRSLRSRKGISFIVARAWREPIRSHQIKALKLLKETAAQRLAVSIAQDLLNEIDALLGRGAFRGIVPVPCGHSAQSQCLSRHIALELAVLLDVPVVEALRLPQSRESSHPKKNIRRSRMSLSRPPEGPVLVIDDVATSGAHMEEACRLLREQKVAVLGLAWIGGNGTEKD
ncbi:Phosphoribosyltransferase domain [Rhabdaerophilaceae bacterium]